MIFDDLHAWCCVERVHRSVKHRKNVIPKVLICLEIINHEIKPLRLITIDESRMAFEGCVVRKL